MTTNKALFAILALTTAVNVGVSIGNYRINSAGAALGGPELVVPADATLSIPAIPAEGPAAGTVADRQIDALVGNAASLPAAADDEAVREIVRDEIANNTAFVIEALNSHVQKQQAEEAASADRKLVEMADAVTEKTGYPFVGNPDGKIEVFYYFDINCGYCKKIDGELRRFVEENPDVKLVHREMPILTPASMTAAQVGGALFEIQPDAYGRFHDTLLANTSASTPEFVEKALIQAVGEDKAMEIVSRSFNTAEDGIAKQVDARIKATLATATEAGINGTPFIFVKGTNTFVRGAAPDLVDQLSAAANSLRK